ncbi:MAG: DAK2 domain-containing protein [Coprococcus sp.]|nr:DAK2 domain-containing protein [Coprococcus sp.]
MLKKAFVAGALNLDKNKEYINELNVFPVPDGDTGTNMTLTILSAKREVEAVSDSDMSGIARAMSTGSLRGARGNSGVILSQLLRGFSKKIADEKELDVHVIADAFQKAVETAYKAVMKPKEGTILTVAKGVATKARECADADVSLEQFCEDVIAHGNEVLDRTPEMLPVLKEAGVVDSGGKGLMVVLQGAVDALTGKVVVDETMTAPVVKKTVTGASSNDISTADIKFGYCTEFIINLEKPFDEDEEDKLKAYLESIGDSIVCVAFDGIVKIHVHTNHPGQAFEKGLTYGYLSNMKVDNMRLEHNERLMTSADKEEAEKQEEIRRKKQEKPSKECGFIAVSMGDGLRDLFVELGVDYVIEGGQTMNPSTEDMLNAIDKVNAKNVFIFPNNKNVVLAANQAADLCEDKNIIVMATANAPQGISAMIAYDSTISLEDNKTNMLEAIENVKSGQVTYAVRDTSIDGKTIKQGDIMGLSDKGLLAVGSDIADVAFDVISECYDEDKEIISIYYGSDVTKEDAEKLSERVSEEFPDCDVSLYFGGQPIYYYIVSVE